MPRFSLHQHWLSIGDDFTIRDERGDDAFWVDGKVFALSDTLLLKTMGGQELATIRRRILSFGPTYDIEFPERTVTINKQLFTFFRCRFTVDQPGPNDFEAAGDFLDHEYQFTGSDGSTAATVSKHWLTLTDHYGIDIASEKDVPLFLCAAVVIDRCCHEKR